MSAVWNWIPRTAFNSNDGLLKFDSGFSYHFVGILASTELPGTPGMFQELLVSASWLVLIRPLCTLFYFVSFWSLMCYKWLTHWLYLASVSDAWWEIFLQSALEQSEPARVRNTFPHYDAITTMQSFSWCWWYGMQCRLTTICFRHHFWLTWTSEFCQKVWGSFSLC